MHQHRFVDAIGQLAEQFFGLVWLLPRSEPAATTPHAREQMIHGRGRARRCPDGRW